MLIAGLVLTAYLIYLILFLRLNIEHEKRRRKLEIEKLKIELEHEAMKLTYLEKQRLDFAMGRHWKK